MTTSILLLGALHESCIEPVLLRAKEDLLPVDGGHLHAGPWARVVHPPQDLQQTVFLPTSERVHICLRAPTNFR